MSLTLILAASCKGIIRELSYAAANTPALAGLPVRSLVKPARNQGLNYSGKSTKLPSGFWFCCCLLICGVFCCGFIFVWLMDCAEKHCLVRDVCICSKEVLAARVQQCYETAVQRQLIDPSLPAWSQLQKEIIHLMIIHLLEQCLVWKTLLTYNPGGQQPARVGQGLFITYFQNWKGYFLLVVTVNLFLNLLLQFAQTKLCLQM